MNARPRLETLFMAVVLVLAALTRFASLGSWPLTDYEAEHAMPALMGDELKAGFWPHDADESTPSPLYHLLTSVIMSVFGASNLTARVLPAFAGFLIFVVLLQFRGEGVPGLKLIWLILLGFSPVLLTISRIASGDILAALCILFILMTMISRDWEEIRIVGIAIASGVGLTTGAGIFRAMAWIAFTVILALVFQRRKTRMLAQDSSWGRLARFAWVIPVSSLMLLTGFGSSLIGVRGFAQSLGDWILAWSQPAGYSAFELILLLISTEPLIVVGGIIGAFRYWEDSSKHVWLPAMLSLGGAAFLILFPGRSPFDLIWIILPLSYLASLIVHELLGAIGDVRSNPELLGLLALLLTFAASGALSFVAYGSGNVLTINPNNPNLVLFLFAALAVMGLSVLVFFGVGWSWAVVLHATGILFLILGFLQGISASWRLNFNPEGRQLADLWWQSIPIQGLPIMVGSIERTAMAFSGHEDQIQIEIQAELSPSIAWALRDFQQREGETAFGLEASPIILTQESGGSVDLPADYVGQSLGLRAMRQWETILPPDPLRWWVGREVPISVETWVLWVRADIASFGEIGIEN